MRPLLLGGPEDLTCLAVGAHADDIEIGAGGTLLRLAAERPRVRLHLVVLTASPDRADEARASARAFAGSADLEVEVHDLPDGRLPVAWERAKDVLEDVAGRVRPDLVLGPAPWDAHQDHSTVAGILPTVFRSHLIWQYEIPKWDGDLGRPTHYVPLDEATMAAKCLLLSQHFPSQSGRDWWSDETFRSLARLRGMECRAPYAEAFAVPKALIDLALPGPPAATTPGGHG